MPIQLDKEPTTIALDLNSVPLHGGHLHTYEAIFAHPLSHNLKWHDVRTLLSHLGHIEEDAKGNLKVTRNGQFLFLHCPRTKDLADADEIRSLRHFLKQSETVPTAKEEKPSHWLLVIDRHKARIFRSELRGVAPQQIVPRETEAHLRHTHESANELRGKESLDPHCFFKPVAEALHAAGQILIFGTGTGTSSEMAQFIGWTKTHHPELAKKIVGTMTVDEHHLTNDQLLAKAREFALPV